MQYSRYSDYSAPLPPPQQPWERRRNERLRGGTERWEYVGGQTEAAGVSPVSGQVRRRSNESLASQWPMDRYGAPPRKQAPVSYAQPQRSSSSLRDGASRVRREGGSDQRLSSHLPPKPAFLPPRPPSEVCLNPPPSKRLARSSLSSESSEFSRSALPLSYQGKFVMAALPRQERERAGGGRPSQAGGRSLAERFQPGPHARPMASSRQNPALSAHPPAHQRPHPHHDSFGPLAYGGATRVLFGAASSYSSPVRQPFVPTNFALSAAVLRPEPGHKIYKNLHPSSFPPHAWPPSTSYRQSSSHPAFSTSPPSSFPASPTSSRIDASPSNTTTTTATSPPPPAKLSPGDPNPLWLEAELFGPAFGTWDAEIAVRKVGDGKRKRGSGDGEEGEEEDPVGNGLDWVSWERRERRKRRRR